MIDLSQPLIKVGKFALYTHTTNHDSRVRCEGFVHTSYYNLKTVTVGPPPGYPGHSDEGSRLLRVGFRQPRNRFN